MFDDEIDMLEEDEVEMLPLIIGGKLIRRTKKIETLEDGEKDQSDNDAEQKPKIPSTYMQYLYFNIFCHVFLPGMEDEDLSLLSPINRLIREKEIRSATEGRINAHVKALLFDPQTNVRFDYWHLKPACIFFLPGFRLFDSAICSR